MRAQRQTRKRVEFSLESVDRASASGVGDSDAGSARSENNILRWTSYLPEDCVRTMIRMGWDVTT
jgi:hypothetical protein